ncbi:hypothetical protein Zm00014a_010170 [Zea mays]|uniref:Uncharacterized protein n=1 Tax=Zea mays TaxID=4577 RepID=A0A3L6FTJ2_MAIZE|nr:hypothetical protein Zm00014a_010170 [Zea mays]
MFAIRRKWREQIR